MNNVNYGKSIQIAVLIVMVILVGMTVPASASKIELAKYVVNEGPFVLGDTIQFRVEVGNTWGLGTGVVNTQEVKDLLPNGQVLVLDSKLVLEPQEYAIFDIDYVVTQADVENGQAINIVSILGEDSDGLLISASTSTRGIIINPSIDIEKATNSDDADNPIGPLIPVGDTVTWTYVVTNTGNVELTSIEVIDDILGLICTIESLAPGESSTCTANGDALHGQYENIGTATGTTPDGNEVTDRDPSHYFGVDASINIEKATNSDDADNPTGPLIPVGDTVTWTYVVTNTGNVELTSIEVIDDILGLICTIESLAPGESSTCTANGDALPGQYENIGTATGTTPDGNEVTDRDPSHYFGVDASIDIEKATNSDDADNPTGPLIPVGDTVTWTYVVTNTGNVELTSIEVIDDILGLICTIESLAPGESSTCTANGDALPGQYENIGTATGTTPDGNEVTDRDPSHYFGVDASIDIEKATNSDDADNPTGPLIPVGDTVTWTYVVTNTGNVELTSIEVIDDILGLICTIESLAPGESSTCTANGDALPGQYENIGTATGTTPDGNEVTDRDPSHYYGKVEEEGCTYTQGYWKNHPEDWPVDSLELGGETYNKEELLNLLKTPTKGDASMILAYQLIAAKLNVENGASPSTILTTLEDADDWMAQFDGKLPYRIKTDTEQGQIAVELAETLDQYNNGIIGPGHCD